MKKLTIQFLDPSNGSRSPAITNEVGLLPDDIYKFRDAFVARLLEDNSDITDGEVSDELDRFNSQLVIVVLDHDDDQVAVSTKPLLTVLHFIEACNNNMEQAND